MKRKINIFLSFFILCSASVFASNANNEDQSDQHGLSRYMPNNMVGYVPLDPSNNRTPQGFLKAGHTITGSNKVYKKVTVKVPVPQNSNGSCRTNSDSEK